MPDREDIEFVAVLGLIVVLSAAAVYVTGFTFFCLLSLWAG